MSEVPKPEFQDVQADDLTYLNLAHQFLDTNFIESTKSNNFNILPVISTNPLMESFVRTDPPVAVDYFSYNLTSKQYHSCWKNISNNQFMKPYELSNVDNITRLNTVQQTDDLMMFLPTTSQARLENACWRAWYKSLKNLKELDPTEINWFKENDVTVLYGPLIEEEETLNQNSKHTTEELAESWNSDCCSSSSENDSDCDSLLIHRHYSLESVNTSASSIGSYTGNDNMNFQKFNKKPDIISPPTTSSSDCLQSNTNLAVTFSLPESPCNGKQLKGILKKRRNVYVSKQESKSSKKRISFSPELSSVRFIV